MSKRTRQNRPNPEGREAERRKLVCWIYTPQAAGTRITMRDDKVYRWQPDGSLRFVGVA